MKNENGNILIILLIAIILLGALTALLTRSGGSTNETGSFEQLTITATEITRFAAGVEAAVTRLRQRGCSENQISFQYDADGDGDYTDTETPNYRNSSSPSDLSCHVFHPNGGGVSYIDVDSEWLDSTHSAVSIFAEWYFSHGACVPGLGTGDTDSCNSTTTQMDLFIFLPFVDLDLCIALNRTLDLAFASSNPPIDPGNAYLANELFRGDFNTLGRVISDTPLTADFFGQKSMCFQTLGQPAANSYHFYRVLIAR